MFDPGSSAESTPLKPKNGLNGPPATFASGSIALGAVFCLLALLPGNDWVYRHITTGRKIRGRKYRLDR